MLNDIIIHRQPALTRVNIAVVINGSHVLIMSIAANEYSLDELSMVMNLL